MKKIVLLICVCAFLFAGCAKAELEAKNLDLMTDIEDLEVEIDSLETEIKSLETTNKDLNDNLNAVQNSNDELTDKNNDLKEQNEELLLKIEELEGPDINNLLGSWMGNSYISEYFEISADKPDSWKYANDSELGQLVGLGLSLSESMTDVKSKEIKEDTVIPLFFIYKGESFSSATSNIFLTMTKYSVKYDLQDIVESYIPQLDSILSTYGETTYDEIETYDVNGIEMVTVEITIDINDSDETMHANYAYFYKNGYLGSLAISYLSDAEDEVSDIIGNMTFN